DYQAQLLWGADARPYLNTQRARLAPKRLDVTQVSVLPSAPECADRQCTHGAVVSGLLVNSGATPLAKAKINVQLRVREGPGGTVSDGPVQFQEKVDLKDLALGPGQTREFALEFPRVSSGSTEVLGFDAVIRVLDAE